MKQFKNLFEIYNQQKSVILTPNRRLASFIKNQYNKQQLSNNLTSWPSLNCSPIEEWLKNLWHQRNCQDTNPTLLDSFSEQVLWHNLYLQITKDGNISGSQINTAQETYQLLCKWQIPIATLTQENPNQKTLHDLIQRFEATITQHQLLSPSTLPEALVTLIQSGDISVPHKQIILVDFEELPPQLKTFFDQLSTRKISINFFDSRQEKTGKVERITFKDCQEELENVANWAKNVHKKNPQQNIGIVIPNLNNIREKVSDIFQLCFANEHHLVNISLGQPLNQYPVIADALSILELLSSTQTNYQQLSKIINSPYLEGYNKEKYQRAFLAEYTQENFPPSFSLPSWLISTQKLSQNYFKKHAVSEILFTNLSNASNLVEKLARNKKFTISEFVKLSRSLLEEIGWATPKMSEQLTATTIATLIRWQQLLLELNSIEVLNQKFTFTQALQLLSLKTNQTIFQPKALSTSSAPISIVGALEAAGLHFDHLWITGLNHEIWPQAARPNIFIPIALQKKLGLPHSCSKRELEFSQNLQQRFLYSAPEIFVSFAQSEPETNKTFLVSPLIKDISETASEKIISQNSDQHLIETIYQSKKIEINEDWQAPRIDKTEKIWGGSKILQLVAACPFQAFASCRLKITTPNKTPIGVSAKERGIFIHAALALLWQKLKSHKNLVSLDKEKLSCLIGNALESAVSTLTYERRALLNNILDLEKQRASNLILAWLEQEKKRTPFYFQSAEKSYVLNIDNLKIKMQIDRIDTLENGEAAIIDYKTGKNVATPSAWQGERPDDVQIPLYALACKNQEKLNIGALAYAQINEKKLAFSGISATENILPNIKTLTQYKYDFARINGNLDELIQHFEQILTKLAQQFIGGNARVDPKYGKNTCRMCRLHSFCRIQEPPT